MKIDIFLFLCKSMNKRIMAMTTFLFKRNELYAS